MGTVLDRLGSTVVELLAGNPAALALAETTAIYDRNDPSPLPHHCVALGIGLDDQVRLLEAVQRSALESVTALVIRKPAALDDVVRTATDQAGIVLLGLLDGVSWDQVDALLRSSLSTRGSTSGTSSVIRDSVGLRSGDLFSLADSICALIDAPITIEDRDQRVLAYSDRQTEVDQARIDTILGRRVPEEVRRLDEAIGSLERLRRAQRPLFLDLGEKGRPGTRPRVAFPVRAGSEVVGTIWGVVTEPLSAEREELLMQAAKLVAVQIVQQQYRFDPREQLVTDLLDAALYGGAAGRRAAAQLNLDEAVCAVVVVDELESEMGHGQDPLSGSRHDLDRRRQANALAAHLGTLHAGVVVAVLRGHIHAVVPVGSTPGAERGLADECERFVERVFPKDATVIGIGPAVTNVDDLPRSREDAQGAIRALRTSGMHRRAVLSADVELESWLLELRDTLRGSGRGPSGAYARLRTHDQAKGSTLLKTLSAWLDTHGDVVAASAATFVHQNTFRYRLKRASEIGQVDLEDPRERLHLTLQIRLFGTGEPFN